MSLITFDAIKNQNQRQTETIVAFIAKFEKIIIVLRLMVLLKVNKHDI